MKSWKAKKVRGRTGRPFQYSDNATLTATTIRHVFKLGLRACEGFLKSIFYFLKSQLKVPCYTQICKRSKKLSLSKHLLKGKKRQWRKLHLAIDEDSQEIIFADITTS